MPEFPTVLFNGNEDVFGRIPTCTALRWNFQALVACVYTTKVSISPSHSGTFEVVCNLHYVTLISYLFPTLFVCQQNWGIVSKDKERERKSRIMEQVYANLS